MGRWRWFMHIVLKSLAHRQGRSLLLLGVLAMAASLVTALGMVSSAMEVRVAEEVKKYGANLVVDPIATAVEVGSGTLDFGTVAEPAYLSREDILRAVSAEGIGSTSFHLRGLLKTGGIDIPAEGVDFTVIRRLYPWWQLQGEWPGDREAIVGTDLAARLKLKKGDLIRATGKSGSAEFRVSGVAATGGEEDKLLFIPLGRMQELAGVGDRVSQARLLAQTGGVSLEQRAARLQSLLPGSMVREVRQVARTSEGLLKKVQLLMALVTAVVLIASACSVASTMSMTVLERGKEIGLLKAMGATRPGVLLLFGGEAAILGLMGGGAGYLAGSGIALFVMKTVFMAHSGIDLKFAWLSCAVSLCLALLGSAGPMISVFRLDPVRSLRGE
jgi:putative ABC transport system permease protein